MMLMPLGLEMLLEVPRADVTSGISIAEADAELRRMRGQPIGVSRPVVTLAGYRAWAVMPRSVARELSRLTGAPMERFAAVSYPWKTDFARIAADVVATVESRWPSDDAEWTVEVDVVGVSMGGLVARAAAMGGVFGQSRGTKRLRIARLFTLATPHLGAKLARRIAPDRTARDMKPGSSFLHTLDDALMDAPYELICYARLRDSWVGATRTAPEGHGVRWVNGTRAVGHLTITQDRRIIMDIAKRLRGESGLLREGLAPQD